MQYPVRESDVLPAAIPVLPKKRIDWNEVLLFINIASVVISYWLAGLTDMMSNYLTKPLRIVLLAVSLYYLFGLSRKQKYYFTGKNSWVLWVFVLGNLYVLPFSFTFLGSFEKIANLLPFLVYMNYLLVYLYRNYTPEQVLQKLMRYFNLIYVFPVLAFIFSGSLGDENIYGENVGGYYNNHYGWACAVFLATSLDLYRNRKELPLYHVWLIRIMIPFALVLLAVSGSRSGYVSVALSYLIFILRGTKINFFVKIFSVFIVMFLCLQLYGDPNSALNKRINKTQTQLEKGDERRELANLCFDTFSENPTLVLTGFGFYAYKEALQELNDKYNPETLRINFHNSYYELLFGCGIIIFTFFLFFFVGRTLVFFFRYHSSVYTFLPPVLLIPFFENNFNPGQFLFFPWFLIMFYYLHYTATTQTSPVLT